MTGNTFHIPSSCTGTRGCKSVDSSGEEGAYDFSEIEAEEISAEEKGERKKIARRSLEDYFDWKHPIRIYPDELPLKMSVITSYAYPAKPMTKNHLASVDRTEWIRT